MFPRFDTPKRCLRDRRLEPFPATSAMDRFLLPSGNNQRSFRGERQHGGSALSVRSSKVGLVDLVGRAETSRRGRDGSRTKARHDDSPARGSPWRDNSSRVILCQPARAHRNHEDEYKEFVKVFNEDIDETVVNVIFVRRPNIECRRYVRLRTGDGMPLANVLCRLLSKDSGKVWTRRTDHVGRCCLDGIPEGSVRLGFFHISIRGDEGVAESTSDIEIGEATREAIVSIEGKSVLVSIRDIHGADLREGTLLLRQHQNGHEARWKDIRFHQKMPLFVTGLKDGVGLEVIGFDTGRRTAGSAMASASELSKARVLELEVVERPMAVVKVTDVKGRPVSNARFTAGFSGERAMDGFVRLQMLDERSGTYSISVIPDFPTEGYIVSELGASQIVNSAPSDGGEVLTARLSSEGCVCGTIVTDRDPHERLAVRSIRGKDEHTAPWCLQTAGTALFSNRAMLH